MEGRIMQGIFNKLFHVCTNGLARSDWFRDEEDFILGMNSVATCALFSGVKVYCFCLMTNHVHFILQGDLGKCRLFIKEYKRVQSRYLVRKYKKTEVLVDADVCIKQLETEEYIKAALAYVVRNPTAAGMPVLPTGYRWSSARLYFSQLPSVNGLCRKISDMTYVQRTSLLRTKSVFPDSYFVDESNIISPSCYVDYKSVEKIFVSPKHWLYYLSSTQDIKMELETGVLTKAGHSDDELSASREALAFEKFRVPRYEILKLEDRYIIARELRKRYGVGIKQLARVTSLNPSMLKSLL